MAVRVMIADNSAFVRDIIRQHLECVGCQVVAEAENSLQALDLFRTVRPDIVTVDPGLAPAQEVDALALFRVIRKESPASSVIVVSTARSPETPQVFLQEGALDCIIEPFDSLSFEQMWRKLATVYPELKPNQPASNPEVAVRPKS